MYLFYNFVNIKMIDKYVCKQILLGPLELLQFFQMVH